MSGYTPGPWKVQQIHCSGEWLTVVDAGGKDLSRWQKTSDPACWALREPDARAIAAVPDLIEALQDALKIVSDKAAGGRMITPQETANEVRLKCRAALAKAGVP